MEATISKIEEDMRTLEAWAETCTSTDSQDMRNIVVIKIASLGNRLERIRQAIDQCKHCGKPRAYTPAYGSICISCNFPQS